MKKNHLLGLGLMATMLFAACQEQEVVENVVEQQPCTVSVNVTTPELAATRAFGDGETAMDLHYAVYNVKMVGDTRTLTYLPELTIEDHLIEKQTTVDLQLVTGNTYDIIFWADNENAPYTLNWDATDENGVLKPNLSIDYSNVTSNNEDYDAFYNWMTINVDASKSVEIDLFRPFAQLNIGTSDIIKASQAGYTLKQTQVKVKAFETLNFFDGTVADETDVMIDLQAADYPNYDENADYGLMDAKAAGYETFPVTGYEYMAMNYLLRPADKQLTDVEFYFYAENGEMKERKYASVPLRRNWRTNIYGQLITSDVDVNVEIVPGFDGAYNREIWDGHTLTKPGTDAEGNVVVYHGDELAYIANDLNGGGQSNAENNGTRAASTSEYMGKTIKLMNNIDLGGEAWNPIGGEFNGTFDGNGHHITNLYVRTEGKASAGLFANLRGVIKNLTVKDAKVYGHYKAGVILGDGLCGKIENCHVENAEVVSTPYNNDDANNVGGIVGYLSAEPTAYVKNSSVKNAVITAYRKVGGIVGAANGASTVTGNTVENVTITADQTAEYCEVKAADAGAVIGFVHANATAENNTVGENVTVIRKVDSTKEMEYAVAEAQNGDVIYVGNGEVALPHVAGKALKFVGIHENAAIVEPVSSHIDEFYKGSSLTFENLKIKGTSYTGKANGYVKSVKEEYINCQFVDGYYMFAGDVVTVTGCMFTGKYNSYFWTGSADDITFTDCQFNGVERIVKVCTVGHTGVERNVTFNGCSFTATELKKAAIEIDGTKGSSYIVNINNCTETGFAAGELTDITMFNVEGADKVTVYVDGNKYVSTGQLEDAEGNIVALSEAGLKEALENGSDVILANPFTIEESESNGYGKTGINQTNGGILDGNGNELGAPGCTGTWDSAINTSGGTIKNLKVTKGFRGIFIKKDSKHNEKLYLDNVIIDGTTYTISCDSGNGLGVEATNSTFNGWTSFAKTIGNAKFTNCKFGEGNGYAYCRPYAPTEFVGCEFEAGFKLDARAAVTFENCTLGGVALTAENLATLVVSNIANATVK